MPAETFTGSNGDPWPSPWTTVSGGSEIQSGRGQQTTPTGIYNSAENRYNTTLTDVRVDVIVRFPQVGNGSQRINIRWNPFTGNGYRLLMPTDYNGFQLLRVDAYVETPIHEEFTTVWAVDTDYWVAFEAVGTTLRARRWPVGASEPSTWTLSGTDATYASGDVSLVTVNAALGGAILGTWDDVTIAAPSPGAVPSGIGVSVTPGSTATAINATAGPAGRTVPASAGQPTSALVGATPLGTSAPALLGMATTAPSRTALPAGVTVLVAAGSPSAQLNRAALAAGLTATATAGTPAVLSLVQAAPTGLAVAAAVGMPSPLPPPETSSPNPPLVSVSRVNVLVSTARSHHLID